MFEVDETPRFHTQPGARERHLKRCYENRLFGDDAKVTMGQVLEARVADGIERDEFSHELKKLFEAATGLAPNVESDVILEMKADCDRLYEQACGLADDNDREKDAIKRLTEMLMKAVWKGAGKDVQAHKELQEEEEARAEHYRLLTYPLVADLLRPDSPIVEQHLVPVLLSEEKEAVAQALRLFSPEHRVLMLEQAELLLADLENQGFKVDEWNQRLLLISEL